MGGEGTAKAREVRERTAWGKLVLTPDTIGELGEAASMEVCKSGNEPLALISSRSGRCKARVKRCDARREQSTGPRSGEAMETTTEMDTVSLSTSELLTWFVSCLHL